MSKTGNIVSFAVGAAIGAAVSWIYTKNMYENLIQEEIDSVKQVLYNRDNSKREKKNTEVSDSAELEMKNYVKNISRSNYAKIEIDDEKNENEVTKEMIDKPYVISPDEFGEIYDYEKISLTYYSDGVLADENDEIVEDFDELIGEDALDSFGEYEDDSVFVRNDKLKCDYEILNDQRDYAEVMQKKPHQVED